MISVLGFKFQGSSVEGVDDCTFAFYPQSLKDTLTMITDAKNFLSETGSKWVEMTMIANDGKKEIVNLYAEQNAEQKLVSKPSRVLKDVDDPYKWSHYN
jgi:hypothetical protein